MERILELLGSLGSGSYALGTHCGLITQFATVDVCFRTTTLLNLVELLAHEVGLINEGYGARRIPCPEAESRTLTHLNNTGSPVLPERRVQALHPSPMTLPLEDCFNDIISKAQRGQGLSDGAIALRTGLSVEKFTAVKGGEFDGRPHRRRAR